MRSAARAASIAALLGACTVTPAPTDAFAYSDTGVPRADAGCPSVDFVRALADPLAPARRLPGRAFLVSSRSPEPQEGMHNDDFGHFVGTDGERRILADETGPGVITRLWFTYGPPAIGTIAEVPIRLTIDGHDVLLDARLGDLASPSSTTFPAPWAMDPELASGGLSISAPIAYQTSARVELTVAPGSWAYYQVDVRRLPGDACVRPFAGTYAPDELAALADGAALWEAHTHPGDDHISASRDLAPGESTELTLDGAGAITTLEVLTPLGARADLALRIEVDGDTAADAPLAWLTGSDTPAGAYTAALTASSSTSAILYAPIPYAASARVVVTSHASAPVSVGLRVRAMTMGAIPADVGRFHAECATGTASLPVHAEQPPFADTYPNIVLAHIAGGPGQFAGITTFQTAPDPWYWALEPDHEVAIDGVYDILGTGTEDYFGGAFYFQNGPYASVTSGASGWSRPTGTEMPIPDAHTHLYRHHVVDTWPFDHELSFEMESYLDGTRYDSCMLLYLF